MMTVPDFRYPRKRGTVVGIRNDRALTTWLDTYGVAKDDDGNILFGGVLRFENSHGDVAGTIEAYDVSGRNILIIGAHSGVGAGDGPRWHMYGKDDSSFAGDVWLLDKDDNTIWQWDESDDQFEYKKPVEFEDGIVAESWTSPTLLGTWVDYGGSFQGARYRKTPDGTVHIEGLVKSGSSGTNIFNLPTGYRPAGTLLFPAQTNSGLGRLDIQADGDVVHNSGGTSFFSITCSFNVG